MINIKLEMDKLEERIQQLDKKKVDILMVINFNLWNRLTYVMEEICEYCIAMLNIKNQLDLLDNMYEDIEERQEREEVLMSAMNKLKAELAPYIKEKDELLQDLDKEKKEELQRVYLEIYKLEERKKSLGKLVKMKFN